MKTYRSKSEIVICVRKPQTGKYAHVRFEPFTLGGSMFTTSDEDLQQAIEHHRFFGTLITVAPPTTPPKPIETIDTIDTIAPIPPSKATFLDFDSMSDAKDYVADTFGVSRTSMRTKEQIEQAAARHGFTIRWKPVPSLRNRDPDLLQFEF